MLSLSHLIAPSLEQNDSLFRCVWSSHGIRDLLQCVKQSYYHSIISLAYHEALLMMQEVILATLTHLLPLPWNGTLLLLKILI